MLISGKDGWSILQIEDAMVHLGGGPAQSITLTPFQMAELVNNFLKTMQGHDWELATDPSEFQLGDEIRLVLEEGYVEGVIRAFENYDGEDGFLLLQGGEEDGRATERFIFDGEVQMVFKAI